MHALRLSPLALAFLAACANDYKLNGTADETPGEEPLEEDPDGPAPSGPGEPGETGAVKGRVCDTSGHEYVVHAKVWADVDADGDGTEDSKVETETDADGWFLLEGLPLGDHTIHIKKGSFTANIDVAVDSAETVELATEECLDPGSAKIAVVTGAYDSIEDILDEMNLEYDLYSGFNSEYLELLQNPDMMAEYDIIFFNCGMSEDWTSQADTIGDNIKSYIQDGGSLYASDWAFLIFETAFPGVIDFYGNEGNDHYAPRVGEPGTVHADVLDPTFQSILGDDTANLNYDLNAWVVPQDVGDGADVLLRGDAQIWPLTAWWPEPIYDVPLAIRTQKGDGTALYTTFHNEQQATVDMLALLNEIILSL